MRLRNDENNVSRCIYNYMHNYLTFYISILNFILNSFSNFFFISQNVKKVTIPFKNLIIVKQLFNIIFSICKKRLVA